MTSRLAADAHACSQQIEQRIPGLPDSTPAKQRFRPQPTAGKQVRIKPQEPPEAFVTGD